MCLAEVVGDMSNACTSGPSLWGLLLQGFHKILKKHDKVLPHAPCQQFYVAHLHHQPWVQVRVCS